MQFNNNIINFLKGKEFSNGMPVEISNPETQIYSRFEFLMQTAKNKSVIHVGCCDHIPLIEDKIKRNKWLHALLEKSAKSCLGIDNDPQGVEFLTEKLNLKNIVCADITQDEITQVKEKKWDFMILGELLEHIDNPVDFLSKIREKYVKNVDKIVITVPNALTYSNQKNVKKHIEFINSDHRYWFTPYTLAKILSNSGFTVESFVFAQEVNPKIGLKAKLKVIPYFKRKYYYYQLKKYPALRTNLIMTARLS